MQTNIGVALDLSIEALEDVVAPCSSDLSNQQNFFFGMAVVGAFALGFAFT